jgi:hypothetical protein
MIRHKVALLDLAFLTSGEVMEYGAQVPPDLPE